MWFISNIARLDKERLEIAKLCGQVDWLKSAEWDLKNGKIILNVKIALDDIVHDIQVIYPSYYPANPPTVTPAERTRLSNHQYSTDGELCLEWGPDNWHEELTGSDMLKSAFKLLRLEALQETDREKNNLIIPSRHSLELGQEIRSRCFRFIENIEYLQEILEKCDEISIAVFDFLLFKDSITIFLKEVKKNKEDEPDVDLELPSEIHKISSQKDGVLVKTDFPNTFFRENTPTAIIEQVNNINPFLYLLKNDIAFALMISVTKETYLFYTFNKTDWCKAVNVPTKRGCWERLGEKYLCLENKKIGIVGVGSAGSKIAMSLCRSGVRNYFLVDHDVFLPENICRHILDWSDVGQHKVDSISRNLKLIHSKVNVETRKTKLSGQEATGSIDYILSQLGQCDIIIDSTADSIVFNQLSAVSCQCEKPFLWLEIFPGGFGGYIARYRPKFDPDPKRIRAELSIYMQENGFPEIESPERYQASFHGKEIMVADDADVSIVSSHITKMALDILLGNNPSIYKNSLYLIGIGKEWVFTQAFHTIPIDLSNIEPKEESKILSEDKQQENMEFIAGLIKKNDNDSLSPKEDSN